MFRFEIVVLVVLLACTAAFVTLAVEGRIHPYDSGGKEAGAEAGVLPEVKASPPKMAPPATRGYGGRLFALPRDSETEIAELDPRTGAEIHRFPAPEQHIDGEAGLAFDGQHLYFINGGGTDTLYRIDPATGTVVDANVITAASGDYDGIACLAGLVYILDYADDDIVIFDPLIGSVIGALDIDGTNPGVDVVGGLAGITRPAALLATDDVGSVYEIDAVSGVVGSSFASSSGNFDAGLAVVDGLIFAGTYDAPNEVRVLDRGGNLLRILAPAFAVAGLGGDDAVLGRLFSLPRDSDSEIAEIDPRTGIEITRFPAPEPYPIGGAGLAFDGFSLYYINGFGSDTLYQIDVNNGAVMDADVISVGSGSYDGIAAVTGLIYILDYSVADIHIFDPRTDTILGTLDIDGTNPGVNVVGGIAGISGPAALVGVDGPGIVYLIDPVTGVVNSSFPSGAVGSQAGIAVSDGLIYAGTLSTTPGELRVLDGLGQHLRTLTLPTSVAALGGDGVSFGRLFALPMDTTTDVAELDPRSGVELRRFPAPEAYTGGEAGMAFDGVRLWFIFGGGSDTLFEMDPATGAVVDADVISAGSGFYDGVATIAGLVYIMDDGLSDIHVFDPETDTIVNTFDIDTINPGATVIGGLAAIGRPPALLATGGAGLVHEIDPLSGVILSSFSSAPGTFEAGLAVIDGAIYSGTFSVPNEMRVLDRTGNMLRLIPMPYSVAGLAGEDSSLMPHAHLGVTIDNGVTEVRPGDSVTYTITVTNGGISAAVGAAVEDIFPPELVGVTWTCAGAGGGVCTASGAGDIFDVVELPLGASAIYTVDCVVAPGATGSLANTATVQPPPIGVYDPDLVNNRATDSDPIVLEVDLWINKYSLPCFVLPGEPITYSITVGNGGPQAAIGATVEDVFPPILNGVTWSCSATGGGACTAGGSGDINDIVDMPVGAVLTYTATGTVSVGATGYLINLAEVLPPMGVTELDASNNLAAHLDSLEMPLFCDGFESGDTIAWSSVTP